MEITAAPGHAIGEDGRKVIVARLWQIAETDGEIAETEGHLLVAIAARMGIDPARLPGL